MSLVLNQNNKLFLQQPDIQNWILPIPVSQYIKENNVIQILIQFTTLRNMNKY